MDLNSESDPYKDYRFTKWMTKNVGLQGIPPTCFYSKDNKTLAENFVRYCFIKVIINLFTKWFIMIVNVFLNSQKDENLQKASQILQKWTAGK